MLPVRAGVVAQAVGAQRDLAVQEAQDRLQGGGLGSGPVQRGLGQLGEVCGDDPGERAADVGAVGGEDERVEGGQDPGALLAVQVGQQQRQVLGGAEEFLGEPVGTEDEAVAVAGEDGGQPAGEDAPRGGVGVGQQSQAFAQPVAFGGGEGDEGDGLAGEDGVEAGRQGPRPHPGLAGEELAQHAAFDVLPACGEQRGDVDAQGVGELLAGEGDGFGSGAAEGGDRGGPVLAPLVLAEGVHVQRDDGRFGGVALGESGDLGPPWGVAQAVGGGVGARDEQQPHRCPVAAGHHGADEGGDARREGLGVVHDDQDGPDDLGVRRRGVGGLERRLGEDPGVPARREHVRAQLPGQAGLARAAVAGDDGDVEARGSAAPAAQLLQDPGAPAEGHHRVLGQQQLPVGGAFGQRLHRWHQQPVDGGHVAPHDGLVVIGAGELGELRVAQQGRRGHRQQPRPLEDRLVVDDDAEDLPARLGQQRRPGHAAP